MPNPGDKVRGSILNRVDSVWGIAVGVLLLSARPPVVYAECSRQWTPEPTLNVARHAHGACVSPCGDVYVVGGYTVGTSTRSVERLSFDGAQYATSWQELSDMPAPARNGHALACTSGFIYVIGGVDATGSTVLANVDRYDILSDSWSTVAVPPLRSCFKTGHVQSSLLAQMSAAASSWSACRCSLVFS